MRYVGQSVTRVEDHRILTGRGRYVDDVQTPGHAARRVRPQPARPRPHRAHRHHRSRRAADRRGRVHRRGHADPLQADPRPRADRQVADVLPPRHRQGPLRRRPRRDGRRHEPTRRRRRMRARRGHLRPRRACHVRRRCDRPCQTGAVRRVRRQPRPRQRTGDVRRRRRRLRRRRSHHRRHPPSAPGGQRPDGDPRHGRRLRPIIGRARGLRVHPASPGTATAARQHTRSPDGAPHRPGTRRGRRLRTEGQRVPRGLLRRDREHAAPSTGQVDRRPQRAPQCVRSRPGGDPDRPRRRQRRRHTAGHQGLARARHGGLPRRALLGRHLPGDHPADAPRAVPPHRLPVRRHGHLDEQGGVRRVSRAMGDRDLGARTAPRHRRPRARDRRRRDPSEEPHGRRPRRPADHRARLRRRHHPPDPRPRPRARRLRRPASRADRGTRRGPLPGHRLRQFHRRRTRTTRAASAWRGVRRAASQGHPSAGRPRGRLHVAVPARPGPRDHVGPGRRRRAGCSDRPCPRRVRRHPPDAVQHHGHRRQPCVDVGVGCGDRQHPPATGAGTRDRVAPCWRSIPPTSTSSTDLSPRKACPARRSRSARSP